MYIEGIDDKGKAVRLNLSRLIVFDDFGNPIAAGIKYFTDTTHIAAVGQEDFEEVLERAGLNSTTLVKELDAKRITSQNLPKLF